jgi:DNA-binding transcriptional regulator YiaG
MNAERIDDAVLETLPAGEQHALAAWLRAQGVEPHRRGMRPRSWVPVLRPRPGDRLEAPLAPGRRPVYVVPPVPEAAPPGEAPQPGRFFPVTETQAAYASRVRRERAARAARGEPVPETRHDRLHRRVEEEERAAAAARSLGAALRAWREQRHVSQTELARRLGLPRPNVARLEAGAVSPTLGTLSLVSERLGASVQLLPTPDGVRVLLAPAGAPAAHA